MRKDTGVAEEADEDEEEETNDENVNVQILNGT